MDEELERSRKRRSTDRGLNGAFRPVAGALFVAVCGGFTWWMTVVWADVQGTKTEQSSLKSDVAVLKSQMNEVQKSVGRVENGVDRLLELQLRRGG